MTRKLLIVAPYNSVFPNFDKLSQKFEAVGYSVKRARLFDQANYQLNHEKVLPHAIFLSHTPKQGFDGLEILRQLKASPLFRGIPVIIYSPVSDVQVINHAYMIGAKHYSIALPPPKDNLDDLMDSLIRVLDLRSLVRYRSQIDSKMLSN